MEAIEADRLLNLGLAIVIPERKFKRKRTGHEGVSEEKMFSLLETRETMLVEKNRSEEVKNDDDDESKKNGLHLIHLLLVSATSLDENKIESVVENLRELYQNVSLNGDSVQRVSAYFADGLVAKLLTRRSPFHEMIMEEPSPEDEFLAFLELYKVSPYYQFGHFTANQSIMEAFETDIENNRNIRTLHVIDLDVGHGFQWPSLMQSLSEKASIGNRVCLRITGFGKTLKELEDTEARLSSFAKTFKNLSFEFEGKVRSVSSSLGPIRKRKNETVVVNLSFYLNSLCNSTHISETLKSIRMLNPSIVVLVEQEGGSRSSRPRTFLSRFMELLHYYAAMFDSLDDFLPLSSPQRLRIERNHLGKEIKRLMDDGKDERMETWKGRMESNGFEGMKLSSKSMIQAKLLLKISSSHCYCPIQSNGGENGGFSAFEREERNAISLAWQDKCLITVSAWQCVGER